MKNPTPINKENDLLHTGLIRRAAFRVRMFIIWMLCIISGTIASAHPGSGIVVDKYGNVYFTDTGKGVWKIDTQGRLSYLPAQLFHWMAIDEAGYFAGSPKNFAEWFERVTPQNSKPVLMMCSDFPLTINKDGNLYYADTRPGSARIIRRTPGGIESTLASDDFFKDVSGITAAPDGSLYVTNASLIDNNIIQKITMDGKVSTFASGFVGKPVSNKPPETLATYCRGLAVDSIGNVYVAATGSRSVLRITPQGKVKTILQAEGSWSPTGVTIFHGEVYVLEWKDAAPSQTEVRKAWVPRVRKIGLDGSITILATVSR